MNKKYYIVLGLIVLILGAFAYFYFAPAKTAYTNLDQFAQCLRDKGVVMYGAYWCPHCLNQKKAFGDSFKYVNYVECTQETQKCTDAGVKGYPTWTFPDGRKFEGEVSLEKLSQESACTLEPVQK